jgi:hypothetical protein
MSIGTRGEGATEAETRSRLCTPALQNRFASNWVARRERRPLDGFAEEVVFPTAGVSEFCRDASADAVAAISA